MRPLLPNPWLLGFGIFLLSYTLIYATKRVLTTRLGKIFGPRARGWDEIVVQTLEHTTHFFMMAVSIYVAWKFVPHPRGYGHLVNRALFIICMIQVSIWMNYFVNVGVTSFINKKTRKNPAAASSISLIQLLAKFLILSIVVLFTLHNIGINITTILAGFGVGGIAVALALQRILGDLFSSLSIVMDKPFMVGDFIILDQYLGEVEKIGLKTTRIRSLSGEQIVISNSDLLATRIRNFKRMRERRVALIMGLPLSTSPEDLRKAVSLIKVIVNSRERVRFERSHFSAISRGSLDIETIYWVLSDDYDLHMDIQQEILLGIHTAFRQEGLNFPYPTSTILLQPHEAFLRGDRSTEARSGDENARSMS